MYKEPRAKYGDYVLVRTKVIGVYENEDTRYYRVIKVDDDGRPYEWLEIPEYDFVENETETLNQIESDRVEQFRNAEEFVKKYKTEAKTEPYQNMEEDK